MTGLRLPTDELGSSVLAPITDLLPAARAELMVMTDTHLVDPDTAHAKEFPSRLRQNERIATAMRVARGLAIPHLIHAGDLVQDYPDNATHAPLLAEAAAQIRSITEQVWFAPGNTDIGDKDDAASPAAPVTADTLVSFARHTAQPWTSLVVGEIHGIVLAASLFNSGLDDERRQWEWFQAELAQSQSRWRILIWHYPTFWRDRHDPGPGNYDVIAEPVRSQLIETIQHHDIAAVFTGHSHFAFLNTIGTTLCFGVPSTSFTRPGFSEMFAGPAPAGHGRDDIAKLGFHLVRFHDESSAATPGSLAGLRVHQVRTGALTEVLRHYHEARPVITATPADLPDSRLEVVLRHPVARLAEIPDVFPSVRRQPVREDYTLLSCVELGARQISVAPEDVVDPVRAARLALLRQLGVRVSVRVLWDRNRLPDVADFAAVVDEIECVLLDRATLDSAELQWWSLWQTGLTAGVSARLSTLQRTPKGHAELPRWRYGFTAAEAVALGLVGGSTVLAGSDLEAGLAAVTSGDLDPSSTVAVLAGHSRDTLASLVSEFLTARAAGLGVALDPFHAMDRTLDVRDGLLDRLGNPTELFHACSVLNSLIHGVGTAAKSVTISRTPQGFVITRDGREWPVGLVSDEGAHPDDEVISLASGVSVPRRLCPGPWVGLPREEAGRL